jgi:DNA-binding transcriptional regulator YiaG/CheY-like chemotaxis protein
MPFKNPKNQSSEMKSGLAPSAACQPDFDLMSEDHTLSPVQIRQLRHHLRLSQADFSEQVGVAYASVNRWENGRTRPNLAAKRAILTKYRYELNRLFDLPFHEEPTPEAPFEVNKLLIVDEDERVLQSIIRGLKDQQSRYEVEVAREGYDAGMKALTFEPDLVILAAKISGISCQELCERLHHNEKTRSMRIVVLADTVNSDLQENLREIGVRHFFTKPLDVGRLIDTIEDLL